MTLRIIVGAALLTALAPAQVPVQLGLSITSGGAGSISASPGTVIPYAVVGTLSSAANEGLAMFAFDLVFDGGPLSPASAPTAAPMNHFARPLGFTNPAGFGGTPTGGVLVQVGGAMNTIASTFAPYPNGPVIPGIAKPATPQVLVTGSLTVPNRVGSFTLQATNVFANVIRQGETGFPFWKVDAAIGGLATPLVVNVVALTRDVPTLSLANPGSQNLALDAGTANAGRIYWLLGSASGIAPGIGLANGVHLPLNYDVYFQYSLDTITGPILNGNLGVLDAQGRANVVFTLPAGLPIEAASLTLHHAFALLFPLDFASNAVALDIDP